MASTMLKLLLIREMSGTKLEEQRTRFLTVSLKEACREGRRGRRKSVWASLCESRWSKATPGVVGKEIFLAARMGLNRKATNSKGIE